MMSQTTGTFLESLKGFRSQLTCLGIKESSARVARVWITHQSRSLCSLLTDFDKVEQTKMNDCYFEKRDWRICRQEVSG